MWFLLVRSMLLASLLAFAAGDLKSQAMPMMRTVEPYNAKVGIEVVVSGDNLGKEFVAEVYLGAGGKNTKVEVTSQSEKELKFKVPTVKPGPYRILVLTKGAEPTMIEEPVRLLVEE
jgi:hypothetical protein